jgi:D-alanyl-D-alanine-carboxypeptidase/D-alanyl-D-alanine-endopeptidase
MTRKVKPVSYILISLFMCLMFIPDLPAQINVQKPKQGNEGFGYKDKGDSIEFVFGQQQKIVVSGVEVLLSKRINDIKQVNLAGDFNGWNPAEPAFQMKKMDGNLYKITICKAAIGKKGEMRQFKFVLNHIYWVEPPGDAPNKFTGKDGNTNLTLKF